MKPRVIPFALSAMLAATCAGAQSQIAQSVIPELKRAGVSDECIARLSSHDFAKIKGILDGDGRSDGQKRTQAKFQAQKGCGQTRSFIFDIFGSSVG